MDSPVIIRIAATFNSGILAIGSIAVFVKALAGDSPKWKGTKTTPSATLSVTLASRRIAPRRDCRAISWPLSLQGH